MQFASGYLGRSQYQVSEAHAKQIPGRANVDAKGQLNRPNLFRFSMPTILVAGDNFVNTIYLRLWDLHEN